METLMLTQEEMTESLYMRAEEIQLQTMLLNRRGIAHGFTCFMGHVEYFDAYVMPLHTNYSRDEAQPERLATIMCQMNPFFCCDNQLANERFQEEAKKMDTYIAYLEYVIERGQATSMATMEGAA